MRNDIVLTLSGPDRVGIVEELTQAILELGGNIGTSRMTRLGGEFAIIMLLSVPTDSTGVERALASFTDDGYQVGALPSHPAPQPSSASVAYRVEVEGADHEGIIHEIARGLSQRGINIESADTWTSRAAVTGTVLFCMTALVAVPAELDGAEWIEELDDAARLANVDIKVALAE